MTRHSRARSIWRDFLVEVAAAALCTVPFAAQAPQPAVSPVDAPIDIQRVALVVGVEDYDKLPHVPNALNDAFETASALHRSGFETIRLVRNPKMGEIEDYVEELANAAGAPGDPAIIVFFFAGHGFQNSSFNYLVPADAGTGDDLFHDSVPVINVIRRLATHRAGLSIFLLDACRTALAPDTPVNLTTVLPGGPIGFATIGVEKNAVVGLATKFNASARSAAHLGDANSPYTTALIKYIPHPAMSLDSALDHVAAVVQQLTDDEQSPEVVKGGTASAFYFVPTERERDVEGAAWLAAVGTGRRECVDRYVRTHPSSLYLKLALQWLDRTLQPDARGGGEDCPDQ